MTEQQDRKSQSNAAADDFDEGISLWGIVEPLWAYRRVIGAAVLGVAALSGVLLLTAFVLLPAERLGSIRFRLMFDGASENKYPNELPFNSAEIVGTPVLSEVYRANDLQRFGPYQSFRDAVFILQSNPALEMLADEYQARLTDVRLTAVDRSRIEEEFRRKRDSLKDPVFTVSMRRNEIVTRMPSALVEKALTDVLATWAKQAIELKGATVYNVPVLSRNILRPDLLETEDYLVAVDVLRVTVNRILDVASKLESLPGAEIIRTGKDQVSLTEVKANLEDVERFQLQPLLGMIRAEGLTKNAQELSRYVNAQLFQLKLRRDASVARLRAVQDALQDYSLQRSSRSAADGQGGTAGAGAGRVAPGVDTQTMIPQLGEGFLDRLIQMSTPTQASEVQYRQRLTDSIIKGSDELASLNQEVAFYDGLERTIQAGRAGANGSAAGAALVKDRAKKALDAIAVALDTTVSLYRDLSAQNLNPSTQLYNVTGPFIFQTQRSLSLRTAGVYFVLTMALTMILVPLGCLAHNALKKKA
ncbi:MAG: hypothetical protein WBD07_12745 [Vicinamibacterales bacterium]